MLSSHRLVGFALLLFAACSPSVQRLSALSAGSMGCPQDEVEISHEQKVNSYTSSWQADCRGRSFVCSITGSQTTCSPMLAPVAAPPPSVEEAAKACAEAEQYDRRAADASSPAKEQFQKIAEHKHHDCAAGQPASAPPGASTPPAPSALAAPGSPAAPPAR
jgi:hypothetical protein